MDYVTTAWTHLTYAPSWNLHVALLHDDAHLLKWNEIMDLLLIQLSDFIKNDTIDLLYWF